MDTQKFIPTMNPNDTDCPWTAIVLLDNRDHAFLTGNRFATLERAKAWCKKAESSLLGAMPQVVAQCNHQKTHLVQSASGNESVWYCPECKLTSSVWPPRSVSP